jgi:hypothetical protein
VEVTVRVFVLPFVRSEMFCGIEYLHSFRYDFHDQPISTIALPSPIRCDCPVARIFFARLGMGIRARDD